MIPKHKYINCHNIKCVDRELIKEYHTPSEVSSFNKFMTGQTGIISEDGKLLIYAHDYERWLEEGKQKDQHVLTWD